MLCFTPPTDANTIGRVAMTAVAGSDRTLIYRSYDLAFRRWTVEIDLRDRRLRLSRQWFGLWGGTVVVDCRFDDCVAVGTVEYNSDGYMTYGTYFKLTDGSWHAIPLRGNSFEAAGVVRQVSAATGIARLDIKYS
jgi:hypothetical protein